MAGFSIYQSGVDVSRFSWLERWRNVATDSYTMMEDVLSLVHGANKLYDMLPISQISDKSDVNVPDVDLDDTSKGGTVGIWWSGSISLGGETLIDNSINFRERLIHYAAISGKIGGSVKPGRFTDMLRSIENNLFQRAFCDRVRIANRTVDERSFWSGPGQANIATSKNFSSEILVMSGSIPVHLFVNTSGDLKVSTGNVSTELTLFVLAMPQIPAEV